MINHPNCIFFTRLKRKLGWNCFFVLMPAPRKNGQSQTAQRFWQDCVLSSHIRLSSSRKSRRISFWTHICHFLYSPRVKFSPNMRKANSTKPSAAKKLPFTTRMNSEHNYSTPMETANTGSRGVAPVGYVGVSTPTLFLPFIRSFAETPHYSRSVFLAALVCARCSCLPSPRDVLLL